MGGGGSWWRRVEWRFSWGMSCGRLTKHFNRGGREGSAKFAKMSSPRTSRLETSLRSLRFKVFCEHRAELQPKPAIFVILVALSGPGVLPAQVAAEFELWGLRCARTRPRFSFWRWAPASYVSGVAAARTAARVTTSRILQEVDKYIQSRKNFRA